MEIKELTNEEFDKFSRNYPLSSVYQTKEYALTMNKEGYNTLLLGLFNNDKIVAATLILVETINKFKYAYAPRGFLIDYNNYELLKIFTNLIKKYLGKQSIIGIKLCPIIIKSVYNLRTDEKIRNNSFDTYFNNFLKLDYYHFGFNNSFEALKPRYEAVIDLRKPIDDLFNDIKKEYKTKIRSAENKGVEIIQGNDKAIKFLYRLSKGKYPRSLEYYENLYDYFKREDNVDIYCAKLNTKKYLQQVQKKYNEVEESLNKYNNNIMMNNTNKALNKKLFFDVKYNKLKEELAYAINLLKNNPNGIVLASILVVKHSDTAYLMIDGYDPIYKRFNAKHLMIWNLIKRYEKEGYKKLNLGGISNIEVNNKYKGLTEFKCNFGANIIEYLGDLELITNSPLYFMYRKMNPINKILHKKKKNKSNN